MITTTRDELEELYKKFSDIFPAEVVIRICKDLSIEFRNRFYSPLTTLWMFIGQILEADHSCRAAVARQYLGDVRCGNNPRSFNTSAYCQARKRLPCLFISKLFQATVEQSLKKCSSLFQWRGRNIKLLDGSGFLLQNNEAIQAEFPTHVRKRKSHDIGNPSARIVALFSLSCGILLDYVLSPVVGAGTAETVLLIQLLRSITQNDIILMDRYYTGFFDIFILLKQGAHFVSKQHQMRKNLKTVVKLGPHDRLVQIDRTRRCDVKNSPWIEYYNEAPKQILLREIEIKVTDRNGRTKTVILLTSIINKEEYSAQDIAELYAERWNVELDLRSMKSSLGIQVIRSLTHGMDPPCSPSLIPMRKEVWEQSQGTVF
jgi:hypothetical protein